MLNFGQSQHFGLKINELDKRIRMTFKESASKPSINVEAEKLPNSTIKIERAEHTDDIYK